MEVKFLKLRENAKLPYKKHINDAGYDLSWAPDYKNSRDYSEYSCLRDDPNDKSKDIAILFIRPGESVLLRTGLKTIFPDGHVMEIKNRSSIASKKQLIVGACIVDSTYRGEIFVNLHNIGPEMQRIEEGDRIAQCIFYNIENIVATEINEQEFSEFETERSDGGFGSTGHK